MKIGIIGSEGYVGKAFCKMVENHYEIVRRDPLLNDSATQEEINKCDLGVVCVPTLMNKDYSCDTSIVEETIEWLDTPVILIKSTIEPGTTDRLKKKTGKKIVMSPEMIGEGKYHIPIELDFSQDMEACPFLILGGDNKDCDYILDLLTPILGPCKTYLIMSTIEAELMKYFENYFLGLKVVFSNEMKEICNLFDANYYKVREGWLADPRVSRFHSIVFSGKEGFSGKCIPKDNNALYNSCLKKQYVPQLLESVLFTNNLIRDRHNLKLDYDIMPISYIAGIIDGEGYIGIKKTHKKEQKSPYYHERISIGSTDKNLLEILKSKFGGSLLLHKPSKLSKKSYYSWELSDKRAAKFCKLILPFLKLKKKQCELVIKLRDSKDKGQIRQKGNRLLRKSLLDERDKLYQAIIEIHGRKRNDYWKKK